MKFSTNVYIIIFYTQYNFLNIMIFRFIYEHFLFSIFINIYKKNYSQDKNT